MVLRKVPMWYKILVYKNVTLFMEIILIIITLMKVLQIQNCTYSAAVHDRQARSKMAASHAVYYPSCRIKA